MYEESAISPSSFGAATLTLTLTVHARGWGFEMNYVFNLRIWLFPSKKNYQQKRKKKKVIVKNGNEGKTERIASNKSINVMDGKGKGMFILQLTQTINYKNIINKELRY